MKDPIFPLFPAVTKQLEGDQITYEMFHRQLQAVADTYALKVAQHLGYSDVGLAYSLLSLPTLTFGEKEFLPGVKHPEAVEKFALDLLQNLPQARAVQEARDFFEECLKALKDTRQEQWQRITHEKGLKTSLNEELGDTENCHRQREEIRALVEETEAFKSVLISWYSARRKIHPRLETWARLYWPEEVAPNDTAYLYATPKNRAVAMLKTDKSNFQTGLEADCLLQGASDGEQLTGYRKDTRRGAWIYERSGAAHRVELRQEAPTDDGETDGETLEMDALEWLIKNQSADFAFAFFYICRLLVPPAPLPPNLFSGGWIDLDDVAAQIGYDLDRCTAIEREELRAKIWQFLNFGARALVIGQRRNYRDYVTEQEIETRVESPAWRILDKERPVQTAMFGETPRRVQLLISKEWEPLLTIPALAQYLPGAEIVAAIPPNQAAGAWARVVGMALANFWRRLPHEATGAAPMIRPTRRELLTRYTPKLHNKSANTPLEILASGDPKRAVKYWRDALAMLAERDFIAREGEAARSVAQMLEPYGRKGWQNAWLDERVDLRPGAAEMDALRERAAAKPVPKPRALNAPKRKTRRAKPKVE